jgi:hypothetical protein
VLIAEQQSTSQLCQDNQVSKTAHYNQSTTRVEVACQAGVCYHSADLLQDKTTLKMKLVVDVVEQECLAHSIINNSNAKMHIPDIEGLTKRSVL